MRNSENKRLESKYKEDWMKWGPYISDRSWGTVREDYSETGDAWNYFPFDLAHKKAYRWGEDGIAGICDRYQILCFSWAFWNGRDSFLKERLFGLNSGEGNHGEDVKEYYYYIDATPTHSYMKFLYKYPCESFPYDKLKKENQKRSVQDLEYELIDTGVFDQDRYFDIFIEYAKNTFEDICIKIKICNRSKSKECIHLLPQLWFRNLWSWEKLEKQKPIITQITSSKNTFCLLANDEKTEPLSNLPFVYKLGKRYLYGPNNCDIYFTDNETKEKKEKPAKDAFHESVIEQTPLSLNFGTKACFYYKLEIGPEGEKVLYFRLTDKVFSNPLKKVEKIISIRKKQADQFYETIHNRHMSEEEKSIQRQALSGLLWSKQIYLFDVGVWLEGDSKFPASSKERKLIRNNHWRHLNSMRIFSMPDKWEYPWFAAWDLAFHCVSLMMVDIAFAKEQLWLLLLDQFLHPSGQIPAYEWEFGDVNPPIQAWAALAIFSYEKKKRKKKDYSFLEKCFHKMLLNFSWWVNKVDVKGSNIFEGGFLGLDNITVIDRSKKLENGALLDQSDGSGWMGMFCLNMMRIALILSEKNTNYESLAVKFFEHYVYIAAAMRKGYWRSYDMWDAEDGWFYSYMSYPDKDPVALKVRSIVGIIPFFSHDVMHEDSLKKTPEFAKNFHWFLKNRKNLCDKAVIKTNGAYVFSLMNLDEMHTFLKRIWDKEEFRSAYGLRSLSKIHEKNPFHLGDHHVQYEPGESLEKIKGGNSNWRGPIWFPINYLFIQTLQSLSKVLPGGVFSIDCSDKKVSLKEMRDYFLQASIDMFKKNIEGRRPIFGGYEKMYKDPYFKDYFMFFEHYHADSGRGLGASHQTGWSALVAKFLEELYE